MFERALEPNSLEVEQFWNWSLRSRISNTINFMGFLGGKQGCQGVEKSTGKLLEKPLVERGSSS